MKLYYEWDDDRELRGSSKEFATQVGRDIMSSIRGIPLPGSAYGYFNWVNFDDNYFKNLRDTKEEEEKYGTIFNSIPGSEPYLCCCIKNPYFTIPTLLRPDSRIVGIIFNHILFSIEEKQDKKFLSLKWTGYIHILHQFIRTQGFYVEFDDENKVKRVIDFHSKTFNPLVVGLKIDELDPNKLVTVWEREE